MNTKFSVAIHSLILISEAEDPMTSEQIAASVGSNPSYIRKVLTLLRNAGMIEAHRGIRGFRMNIPASDLSLYQIYQAISNGDELQLFDIHQNPNDQCIVGRHIKNILEDTYSDLQIQLLNTMKAKRLKDCIDEIRNLEEVKVK